MKKILVTGASGFLGWYVIQQAPADWRVVGTWHHNPNRLPSKSEAVQLDLIDRDATWNCLKAIQPDAVFHLAAASNPSFCEANQQESSAINVNASTTLAEMCAERKCKFFFSSSEQVYDGEFAPYNELNQPIPQNEYGRQKLAAEQAIQDIDAAATIVRFAVMYGQAGLGIKNFLGQCLETWRQGEPVTAFEDEIRSFLPGKLAAEGLFLLLKKDVSGIFNVGGGLAMSRLDFAKLAAEHYQLPNAIITSKSQKDVEMVAFRPQNLTLDMGKIQDIGFVPNSVPIW
ncbi:MAG: sugar nucleotide-binding protein [Bacteroidetes bacterium]|nr:sugar nucleotide-binding protein [Bacteroidota bacterium]